MGEWGAKPGIEIPVVPRAGTQLCSGTGPGEGKPGRVFSSGAPKTSRGCCWCHGHWENKVPCPQSLTGTPMPPRTPLCPCPPAASLPSPAVAKKPCSAGEVYFLRPRRAISSALAAALSCSSFSLARSSRIFNTWVGTSSDRDTFLAFFLAAGLLAAGLIGQGNAFLADPSSSGGLALSG